MVAEEGPPEVAEEFRRTFEEQRFGLPFEDALLGLVDRTSFAASTSHAVKSPRACSTSVGVSADRCRYPRLSSRRTTAPEASRSRSRPGRRPLREAPSEIERLNLRAETVDHENLHG